MVGSLPKPADFKQENFKQLESKKVPDSHLFFTTFFLDMDKKL